MVRWYALYRTKVNEKRKTKSKEASDRIPLLCMGDHGYGAGPCAETCIWTTLGEMIRGGALAYRVWVSATTYLGSADDDFLMSDYVDGMDVKGDPELLDALRVVSLPAGGFCIGELYEAQGFVKLHYVPLKQLVVAVGLLLRATEVKYCVLAVPESESALVDALTKSVGTGLVVHPMTDDGNAQQELGAVADSQFLPLESPSGTYCKVCEVGTGTGDSADYGEQHCEESNTQLYDTRPTSFGTVRGFGGWYSGAGLCTAYTYRRFKSPDGRIWSVPVGPLPPDWCLLGVPPAYEPPPPHVDLCGYLPLVVYPGLYVQNPGDGDGGSNATEVYAYLQPEQAMGVVWYVNGTLQPSDVVTFDYQRRVPTELPGVSRATKQALYVYTSKDGAYKPMNARVHSVLRLNCPGRPWGGYPFEVGQDPKQYDGCIRRIMKAFTQYVTPRETVLLRSVGYESKSWEQTMSVAHFISASTRPLSEFLVGPKPRVTVLWLPVGCPVVSAEDASRHDESEVLLPPGCTLVRVQSSESWVFVESGDGGGRFVPVEHFNVVPPTPEELRTLCALFPSGKKRKRDVSPL